MVDESGQCKVPATYMRGGTSKGVFFHLDELPSFAQTPGSKRDRLLIRIIGSPDPYAKNTDGMGGGQGRSENKVAIISKGEEGHDVNFLFGQVSVKSATIDWSGNCGNLLSAVGLFALRKSLIDPKKIPKAGILTIRIWQMNIKKTIVMDVPIEGYRGVETGHFKMDGVAFTGSEIKMEYLEPSLYSKDMFPTTHSKEYLIIGNNDSQKSVICASLVNAGIPTVFVLMEDISIDKNTLKYHSTVTAETTDLIEAIRIEGAIKMGLFQNREEAVECKYIPAVAIVEQPSDYTSSDGSLIEKAEHDIKLTLFSMGNLHHAVMGTVSVASACLSRVPGTIFSTCGVDPEQPVLRIGHPSGVTSVKGSVVRKENVWHAEKAQISRSARTLMEGHIFVPTADI